MDAYITLNNETDKINQLCYTLYKGYFIGFLYFGGDKVSKSQNIYDNDEFFSGYKKLRDNEYNSNSLIEQPAIKDLLPDLKGKTVLDLGCGFGANCVDFIKRGAVEVIGIDISEKMLNLAGKDNAVPGIKYVSLDMNDIDKLSGKFDVAYSSLSFHYIEDFNKLISNIFNLLNNNGILIFSQEHPLTTAPQKGVSWNRDEKGNKVSYNVSDYLDIGERKVTWFIDGVIKYHRTISSILNIIINNGFVIEKVVETMPDSKAIAIMPAWGKEIHKPDFLVIRARKT